MCVSFGRKLSNNLNKLVGLNRSLTHPFFMKNMVKVVVHLFHNVRAVKCVMGSGYAALGDSLRFLLLSFLMNSLRPFSSAFVKGLL